MNLKKFTLFEYTDAVNLMTTPIMVFHSGRKNFSLSSDNQFYVDGLLTHDEINSIIIAMVAI